MSVASAGVRDRLVRVEWRPVADDVEASGFPKDDWTTYRDVYMARTIAPATERFQSDQTSAVATARWECEYLADMDPDVTDVPKRFRLQYGGRAFDIVSASVIGRQRALALMTLAPSGVA
jgi:head-tail adaptor